LKMWPLKLQVKIRNWINGDESTEYVGVSARFGQGVSEREEESHSVPLAMLDPLNSCNQSVKMVCFFTSSCCSLHEDAIYFCD
jgi:hypothetical protein